MRKGGKGERGKGWGRQEREKEAGVKFCFVFVNSHHHTSKFSFKSFLLSPKVSYVFSQTPASRRHGYVLSIVNSKSVRTIVFNLHWYRYPSISPSLAGIQHCHQNWLFRWILRFELKSSSLQSKYFTSRAISIGFDFLFKLVFFENII